MKALCRRYTVSRSGYYAWLRRAPAGRSEQDRRLLTKIQAVYAASEGTYGSPRIHGVLQRAGVKVSRKRVARLMREAGLRARVAANVQLPPIFDQYNLEKIPSAGDTVAFEQKEIFEGVYANVSLLRSLLEGKIGVVENETAGLRDFFQSRLRSAIFRPPENEREVQGALEQLMIGRGLQKGQDYDREVGRVKMSSKEAVPDFVMLRLSLAIEVKLIKSAARVKEAIDEVNADIAAYSKRYASLMFIVYDLGYIRDEVEFRHDLESQGRIAILVVKQ